MSALRQMRSSADRINRELSHCVFGIQFVRYITLCGLVRDRETCALESDSRLLALERQFNAISGELLALERVRHDRKIFQRPAAQAPEQAMMEPRGEEHTCDEDVTRQIESVLARLDPIERAIMQTQARTIAGLGAEARHAAYVMSQYWEDHIDQIDWDAQAVRLLIEAVCDVALTPLPFRNVRGHE
jgi:hypothetical protein